MRTLESQAPLATAITRFLWFATVQLDFFEALLSIRKSDAKHDHHAPCSVVWARVKTHVHRWCTTIRYEVEVTLTLIGTQVSGAVPVGAIDCSPLNGNLNQFYFTRRNQFQATLALNSLQGGFFAASAGYNGSTYRIGSGWRQWSIGQVAVDDVLA